MRLCPDFFFLGNANVWVGACVSMLKMCPYAFSFLFFFLFFNVCVQGLVLGVSGILNF